MLVPRTHERQRRVVIVGLAASGFVVSGLGNVATGMFIGPMMTEFAWTNGQTSAVAPAYTLSSLLVTPAVGVAVDRFGARAVMTMGILTASAAYFLASYSHGWHAMVAAFALAGVGYAASFYLPSAVVIAEQLSSERSLAMGVVLGAASVGAAVFSPFAGWLIEKRGWRNTLELMSALVVLMLPLLMATLGTRASTGLRSVSANANRGSAWRFDRALLFSPVVLASIGSSALFTFGIYGIQFHVVPVLERAGLSSYLAGWVFGATWLLSSVGSVAIGVSADRLGAKRILAASLLCGAIGTLFLLGVGKSVVGVGCVVAFVLLWGIPANGAFQLIPVIFAERFGSKALGVLIGAQSAIAGIAGAGAPVITGLLYDKTLNYGLAICLSASITMVASLLALSISACRGAPEGGSTAKHLQVAETSVRNRCK
jgi:MFS family permease